jgi:hypothetical protein
MGLEAPTEIAHGTRERPTFDNKRHIAATSRGAPDPTLGAELEKLAAEFDAAAEAARGAN